MDYSHVSVAANALLVLVLAGKIVWDRRQRQSMLVQINYLALAAGALQDTALSIEAQLLMISERI